MFGTQKLTTLLILIGVTFGVGRLGAEESVAAESTPTKTTAIKAAGGVLTLQVPSDWEKKQARSNIIEHEYWAPATEGDDVGGRMTTMRAGGSVKANLDRWRGQIKVEGDAPEVETFEVAGQTVHVLDQKGTYMDRRGPFAPATARENYRVIGAIVELKSGGLYFLKFYGPAATINQHADSFRALLKGINVNK